MRQRIPKSVRDELRILRALTGSRDGPIADTYDRLQGLVFLQAARAPRDIGNHKERAFIALSQCRALIHYNIAHLLIRIAEHLNSRVPHPIDGVSSHLRWIHSLAKLSLEISDTICGITHCVNVDLLSASPTLADQRLVAAFGVADEAMLSYEKRHSSNIVNAIGHHPIHNGDASAVHYFKSSFHLLSLIQAVNTPAPTSELLSEHLLDMMVHSLDTPRPSYLMQFRLLHQVPEILGAEVRAMMTDALEFVSTGDEHSLLARLRIVQTLLTHMTNCLWPLLELMIPSEYYEIRRTLGVTSGSKSIVLAKGVLRNDYIKLAVAISGNAGKFNDHHLVLDYLWKVRSEMKRWRSLHMFLPWSILGVDATSLIGSNASEKVKEMAASFDRADPFTEAPVHAFGEMTLPHQAVQNLVQITGSITRRRFPDVENREGIYRGKGIRHGR